MTTSVQKRGVVAATNAYGFKLVGSDEYFDYSKQAEVPRPAKGDTVTLGVTPKGDGKWWVNRLTIEGAATGALPPPADAPNTSDDLARTMRRSNLVTAAVHFLAYHERPRKEQVLQLAAYWERWVTGAMPTPPVQRPAEPPEPTP